MTRTVVVSSRATRQLREVPEHVARKFGLWVEGVETEGPEQIRKVPGFHDEPLRGQRAGKRSIRLSRSYRATRELRKDDIVESVSVEEVNKHDY